MKKAAFSSAAAVAIGILSAIIFVVVPTSAFVTPQVGMGTRRNSRRINHSYTYLKMDVPPNAEQLISFLLTSAADSSTPNSATAAADAVSSSGTNFSPFGQGNRGLSYYSTLALYGEYVSAFITCICCW